MSDATAYARPDIARAVEDAEMVDDGYLVLLKDEQAAWLLSQELPTGRAPLARSDASTPRGRAIR